ncbi:hypothetical protein [Halomonas campaniensis]|uniref:Uncharacterized protein n=1 Tax=Halomonas campaniensis TaxID=213554 RepID=A0A246S451_9GAMM|nr:hypothetical protein [Halomonas campaniensis]OWV31241.1 hypothetical protein JI62_02505 [Halomonas campaniensis]
MKPENKVFLGGALAVLLLAFGYVLYINIGGGGNTAPSEVAFSNTSGAQNEVQGGAANDSQNQSSRETEVPETTYAAPEADSQMEAPRVVDYPTPVPAAERDGGEVAQALRNLRVQTEAFQQGLIAQGQALRSLEQQVDELVQNRQQYQTELSEMQRSNNALRSELSGKALYAQSNSADEGRTQNRNTTSHGFRLTKLLEDEAWIHTPQGRTYIVGEGDWFGNEYVISINNRERTVVTTAGELAL